MPRELFARILLARRRDVRMRQHAMRRHVAAEHDAAAQRDHRGGLAQRKIRITPVMAAIDDLDPDRTGIDVFLAGPGRHAGMPGAFGFQHALHDTAVLEHDVMRGDIGARRAQPRDRAFDVRHAGIVQDDHVGRAAVAALAIVRRRDHVGRDRRIGGECLHVRIGPGEGDGALALRLIPNRCERTRRHGISQTGQESGNTAYQNNFRLLFLYDVAKRNAPAGLRIAFWPSVCGKHHCAGVRLKAGNDLRKNCAAGGTEPRYRASPEILATVNAFLTLTDVTKW